MAREFTASFSEVPLIMTPDGFRAGMIEVNALISYWPSGEWSITGIYLDGYRNRPSSLIMAEYAKGNQIRGFEDRLIEVPRGTDLHRLLLNRLETDWRPFVQDAVRDQIELDHDEATDYRADRREFV